MALTVTLAEQGMKLLRFLERRLQGHEAKCMLHKWIRTGQVRVNRGRTGPYHLLNEGDIVRLPPFALARQVREEQRSELELMQPGLAWRGGGGGGEQRPLVEDFGPGLRMFGQTADYLVLAKCAGLPTQSGLARRVGNADSVAERLRAAFREAPFIPAPAHRLDTQTSGLVLVGKSHAAQRHLHTLFRENAVRREYLAWVPGAWPHEQAVLLQDNLEQEHRSPVQALSVALPVHRLALSATVQPPILSGAEEATLLLVRLLTGRKHQIRVQLASRGFPIIGDARYGGLAFGVMLLHAYALALPPEQSPEQNDASRPVWSPAWSLAWDLLPEWPAPFMPEAAALNAAFSASGLYDIAHIRRDISNQESIA